MTMFELTIEELCDKIGWLPEDLAGNCHAVSTAIVRSGVAGYRARVVRGHYRGYVGQHSWVEVETEDGTFVIDATVNGVERGRGRSGVPRLFVGQPPDQLDVWPCVYCGTTEDEHPFEEEGMDTCDVFDPAIPAWPYDEAGQDLRDAMAQVFPYPEPEGEPIEGFVMPTLTRLAAGHSLRAIEPWTPNRLLYLGSRSIRDLGGPQGAQEFFRALDDVGLGAAVPLDSRAAAGMIERTCRWVEMR